MKERGFNLFAFIKDDYVEELGASIHEVDGTDPEKIELLRRHAGDDVAAARRFPLPARYRVVHQNGTTSPGIHYSLYQRMTNGGLLCDVFREVLDELGASQEPLVCATQVVDGVVRIDGTNSLPPSTPPQGKLVVTRTPAPDYLVKYMTDKGFDLASLLNDDYLRAIKLLFNSRLYVSSAKLLMSFVETVAYLDAGDTPGNFQHWITSYAPIAALGVTADELWELRNSLLHMTNVDSRKVLAGKARRLLFFVGTMPTGLSQPDGDTKFFNLHELILALITGIERWLNELLKHPDRMAQLFERYDRILSDVRYDVLSHSSPDAHTSPAEPVAE